MLSPTSSSILLKSEDFLEEEELKISYAIHKTQHATAAPSGSVALKITPCSQLPVLLQLECLVQQKMCCFQDKYQTLAPASLQEEIFSFMVTIYLLHHHHHHTYQDQASVHQGEGSWASDPSAAVHHRGPVLWVQRTRLPDLEEEFEEGGRRFRHTKVGPCGVVKMEDLPGLPCLLENKR